MKKSLLLSLVVALFCIACGSGAPTGELTRNLAKDILVKHDAYSGYCSEKIFERTNTTGNGEWLSGTGKKLQDAGYISISAPDRIGDVHITVLEKLKPFIVSEYKSYDGTKIIRVKLGNIIIDDINGITDAPMMGTNTKQVEYNGHVKPNELANIVKLPWRCEYNKTQKFTNVFKKYDDGWRVEQLKLP